jgi:hypothetical protein
MRSVLWKTFGLPAPFLIGLLGFSSPSEELVGGRVAALVCGDAVEMLCHPFLNGEECRAFTKWGDAGADTTKDDYYERAPGVYINRCSSFNRNKCQGMGDAPLDSQGCMTKNIWEGI